MTLRLLALFALAPLAACTTDSPEPPPAPAPAPPTETAPPAPAEASPAEAQPAEDFEFPTVDDPELGTLVFADDVTGDAMIADTPEDAVRAWMEGGEAEDPEIRVLSRTPEQVRILATVTGLQDDSIRDERTLFLFTYRDGAVQFDYAARQFRCQPGRGHQDWSAALCL